MMMVMTVMIMLTTTTMMMMVMPEKSETRQRTSAVGDGGAEHTESKFLASTLENSFILVTRVILFDVMEGPHGSGQAGESVLKHRFIKVTRWCADAWYTRGEDFTKSGFNPELNRRISVLYWSSVHQSRLYETFLHQTCNADKVPIYCERFSVPNLCTTALVPGRRVSSLGVNTVTASLFSSDLHDVQYNYNLPFDTTSNTQGTTGTDYTNKALLRTYSSINTNPQCSYSLNSCLCELSFVRNMCDSHVVQRSRCAFHIVRAQLRMCEAI